MSDYLSSKASKQTLHRGDGIGGRGILFALLVGLGIIALLAVAGSIGGAGDGTTTPPGPDLVAPAAKAPPIPTE